MKKSEFRKIIKEEVKQVMSERKITIAKLKKDKRLRDKLIASQAEELVRIKQYFGSHHRFWTGQLEPDNVDLRLGYEVSDEDAAFRQGFMNDIHDAYKKLWAAYKKQKRKEKK